MAKTAEQIAQELRAPFPPEAVSWKPRTLTKDGSKALALAYIDARDVQNRLDEVLGVAGWQVEYDFAGTRTIARLSIKIDGEWIVKSDGAGDTQVEGEKGGISDALKRAAVCWGVGRYLYDLGAPWVPCESYEAKGKKHFSKWTADPWSYIKGAPSLPKKPSAAENKRKYEGLIEVMLGAQTLDELQNIWQAHADYIAQVKVDMPEWFDHLVDEKDSRKQVLQDMNLDEPA